MITILIFYLCLIDFSRDFSWSPSENILAYWTPEAKDNPARVTLLEIPSRRELRVKNLFNVGDCKMHWQMQGDYLCVKVDRVTKSKKVCQEKKVEVAVLGVVQGEPLRQLFEVPKTIGKCKLMCKWNDQDEG